MLTLENRASLLQSYSLLPVIEGVAKALKPGWLIMRVEKKEPNTAVLDPGWIVFGDSELGFAVNTHGTRLTKSTLASRLWAISDATEITRNIRDFVGTDLRLNLVAQCPAAWICYRVAIGGSELSLAFSESISAVTKRTGAYDRIYEQPVRLPVCGVLEWREVICVGASKVESALALNLPSQGLRIKISLLDKDVIKMEPLEINRVINSTLKESESESEDSSVLVQVNLGEIELSLRELAALRSGACIELSTQLPIECVLRVGLTTLAKAELSSLADKMSLTITEVLS